jgi:hypothetical protein
MPAAVLLVVNRFDDKAFDGTVDRIGCVFEMRLSVGAVMRPESRIAEADRLSRLSG